MHDECQGEFLIYLILPLIIFVIICSVFIKPEIDKTKELVKNLYTENKQDLREDLELVEIQEVGKRIDKYKPLYTIGLGDRLMYDFYIAERLFDLSKKIDDLTTKSTELSIMTEKEKNEFYFEIEWLMQELESLREEGMIDFVRKYGVELLALRAK